MDDKKFNKYDLRWMMSLFGTAVGAGILFLPIKAGAFGIRTRSGGTGAEGRRAGVLPGRQKTGRG